MRGSKNKRKREWVVNLGIVVVTVVLCLLAFEGVLRVTNLYFPIGGEKIEAPEGNIFEADALLGSKHKPNSMLSVTFLHGSGHPPGEMIAFKINSKGLRDDEYDYNKPENTTRILLLGDSFTFGDEVNREDNIPENMERILKKYRCQVLNFGVCGYGTIQEYLSLKEEGVKYEPDVVLTLLLTSNDGRDNLKARRLQIQDGKIIPPGKPFLISARSYLSRHSYVYQLLGRVYYGEIGNNEGACWKDYEKQVNVTNLALKMIDDFCRERNIKHEVVIIPDGTLVESGYRHPVRRDYNENFKADVIAGFESANVSYIDLTPLLKVRSPKAGDLYFNRDGTPGHFNAKGYKMVAEILVEEAKKKYLGGE